MIVPGANAAGAQRYIYADCAVNVDPDAETLADMGRKDDARKEAQAALDAPLDPNWAPEDRRFKETAKRLLRDLQR